MTVEGVRSGEEQIIELDPNRLPSILEICFKGMGGRVDSERTITVTGKDDGIQRDFVLEADMDYTGWFDDGVPENKKGKLKVKALPEHALYSGTVDGIESELSLYPEMDGDPAEYFLVINPKED